jgi:LysM repeat protein
MKGDSFWSIAKKFNISVKALQSANSNIRADQLQWGAKIEIPEQSADAASSQPEVSAVSPSPPVTNTGSVITYKVKAGDYLARIAANHGTTVKAVRSANNLRSDLIRIGQTLKIPSSSGQASSSATTPSQRTASAPSGAVTVTVQAGDALESIARRFEVSTKELMDANGITNPRSIRPGQVLIVPGFQSVTVQPTVPEVETTDPEPVEITETLPLLPEDDLDSMLPEDVIDAPAIPIDEEPSSAE